MSAVQQLRVRVIRTTAELDGLASAWGELMEHVPDATVSQTFLYSRTAWTSIHEPRGGRLAVITVWQGDELLVVWPLHIERRRGYTLAAHLGNTSRQEYAYPAVRPCGRAPEALARTTDAARRLADVLAVHHVPDGPLPMTGSRMLRSLAYRTSTTSHVACLPDGGGFDAWLMTRPQKLRWEIRRNRKRLDQAGAVEFVTSDADPADGHHAIGWIFHHKAAWLAKRRLQRPWITDGAAEGFFHDLLEATAPKDSLRLLVVGVKLDGRFVSASICYRSPRALEGFMIATDDDASKLAPGNVLMEECVRHAFEMGCDFDFRIDPFDYKLRWTDEQVARHSLLFPCTVRGVPHVLIHHLGDAYGALRKTVIARVSERLPTAARATHAHEPLSSVARAAVGDCVAILRRRHR